MLILHSLLSELKAEMLLPRTLSPADLNLGRIVAEMELVLTNTSPLDNPEAIAYKFMSSLKPGRGSHAGRLGSQKILPGRAKTEQLTSPAAEDPLQVGFTLATGHA